METLDTIAQDLRYGFRRLARRPLFTIITILTLGLGVGATSAVVSLVKAVLVDPLPFPNSQRVGALWQTRKEAGIEREDVSPANFLDVSDRVTALTSVAAAEPAGMEFLNRGEPLNLAVWRVSDRFFAILGVKALHGRTFTREEHEVGRSDVVILSYRLWRGQFGGDAGIVGRTITLSGRPHVVVGVMDEQFEFPSPRDMWLPRPFADVDRQRRSATYFRVIGLLADGRSLTDARAELQAVAAQLSREYPDDNSDLGLTIIPLREYLFGSVRPVLISLLGGVTFVLLIACANVASLLVGQGLARRRELAVRTALGADRRRLFGQLVIESLVLAILGGMFGAILAYWIISGLSSLWASELPSLGRAQVSWSMTAIAGVVLGFTVLLFGVLPARRLSGVNADQGLREGPGAGRAWTGSGMWRLVVTTEVALALALLVGAMLLSVSLINLLRVDLGFSPRNVAVLQVFVWRNYPTEEQRVGFFEQSLENIRAMPGIEAAAAVSALPFTEETVGTEASFTIPGHLPSGGVEPTARASVMTTDYFRVMEIRVLEGRNFASTDTEQAPPVVVVSRSFAQRHLAGRSALGERVLVKFGAPVIREVVGVVDDVRTGGIDIEPQPSLYVPHRQYPIGSMTYVVRTDTEPDRAIGTIKASIWRVNKILPFRMVSTMEALVQSSLADRRFAAAVLSSFAGFALLVMWLGLFGIVNYWVVQRVREIGIRVALGADQRTIVRWVVGQAMAMVAAGIVVGILAALGLTQFLERSLFGVRSVEPSIFAAVAALIVVTAAAASYLPARKVAQLDPSAVLRAE